MKPAYRRKKHRKAAVLLIIMLLLSILSVGCGDRARQAVLEEPADKTGENRGQTIEYIHGIPLDKNTAVVTVSVADVYEEPDVKSMRVTQVLCNQPVSVISQKSGWARVKTISGITGWIRSKFISDDISSISGRVYTYRIVVTSKEKTVYSRPGSGATMVNAHMGTEFYAFNSRDDAYEVFLPGNRTGWLKGSGIIRIDPPNGEIPATNASDFAATALKFKGASFMLNGLTSLGIDAPGLVYICARINGVDLPITLEGQLNSGEEIPLEKVQVGDLVFLSETAAVPGTAGNEEAESGEVKITSVGICTGGSNYIYAGRKTGYVAIGDLYRENPDGIAVMARRIFN
ncbi:MAG TPA: SH3 domain-containing protein [Clostridiales bacterium]|nr:SH3 domain-containing protein [Clostridiales bacterium]